jgi:hypothetical protein
VLLYIDPVSGTIIVQAIIAASVGAAAFFRKSIVGTIKSLFGKKSDTDHGKKSDTDQSD